MNLHLTKISYNNNTEYRNTLRSVFHMNMSELLKKQRELYTNFDTFDEETRDELLFDDNAIEQGLNFLYEKTRNYKEFTDNYLIAAGFMFSENPEIGLAVLLSYDYFSLFYSGLVAFFEGGIENLTSSPDWIELRKKLTRK
jgi:hypothetical protein